jgi:hypothetical protein
MIDAIIPNTVNIIPLLNALVPGLNIQNAEMHIKNKATAKTTVK